ncbi:MAG TPA: hypothetical protein PKD16_19325 [Saprospiraceae bacterium]|jgi:hypothetical protein|nr:hypothetical protein [Saprospiraceae bacterium]
MRNYINFRVIENADTKCDAIEKLECGDISETHPLSDELIELSPEIENVLSGYIKKSTKSNAKLIPADIVKFADYYERQLLPTTLSILYAFGLVYEDQKLKEDIYSVNNVLENEDVFNTEGKTEEVKKRVRQAKKELKLLDKILSDNDCAYIRIIS